MRVKLFLSIMNNTLKNAFEHKPLLAALLCAGTMIYLSGMVPYNSPPFSQWDLHNYRLMAQASPHIDRSVCPPYLYRILGPYIVGLFPGGDATGFYLAAILCSLLLVVVYFRLLCAVGISPRAAGLATMLLTMNRYFFGFTVWDCFQIDDLIAEVLLLALFLCMFKLKWGAYSVLLLLGSLTRESVFIIVPATLVFLWERKKIKEELMPLCAAILPGVMVFIVLRVIIKSTCTDHESGLPGSGMAYYWWAFFKYLKHFIQPETLFRRLVNAFVPFSFLPIIFFQETGEFLVRYKHLGVFYVLVFISAVFGGDAERLMAPAFIVFYMLLGRIIDKTVVNRPLGWMAVIGIAFVSTIHHQNARFLLPSQKYTVLFSMGSLLLMTLCCIFYRIKYRRRTVFSGFR